MNERIKKLLDGKWGNRYFCKLVILDHLRECLEKDNYIKATDTSKDSESYKLLDKELMDLRIALELYFQDESELYEIRLSKFLENLDK
jgi:hypothetical protein